MRKVTCIFTRRGVCTSLDRSVERFLRELRAGKRSDIKSGLVKHPGQKAALRPVLEAAVLFDQEFRVFRSRYPGSSLCRMFGIRRRIRTDLRVERKKTGSGVANR